VTEWQQIFKYTEIAQPLCDSWASC